MPKPASTKASDALADSPAADAMPALLALPQDEQPGWRELATQWGVDAAALTGPDICQALRAQQLRCYRSNNITLAQLQQMDRPGLLLLHLPDGQNGQIGAPRWARLVALGPQQVVLANGSKADARGGPPPLVLPRAELARWWRGEYSTLWRPPQGYAEVLQPGARGPAVDALARALALFHSQAPPSADQVLTGALAASLAGFQVAQNLRPDGLAGPTTFMHLNRATGVGEPRLRSGPPER